MKQLRAGIMAAVIAIGGFAVATAGEAGATTDPALKVTVTPQNKRVKVGTPVRVTLKVRNTGTTTLRYVYDTDGCDPALNPNATQFCTDEIRMLTVPPRKTVSTTITIDTSGVFPDTYLVPIGDEKVVVRVTGPEFSIDA